MLYIKLSSFAALLPKNICITLRLSQLKYAAQPCAWVVRRWSRELTFLTRQGHKGEPHKNMQLGISYKPSPEGQLCDLGEWLARCICNVLEQCTPNILFSSVFMQQLGLSWTEFVFWGWADWVSCALGLERKPLQFKWSRGEAHYSK